ncbi:MAG: dihydropteroate synthase [Rhodobacteraceae bacterium GWE1_64_9]|nr:MAG: dihydropteroate synthase [Rhodobacteraceae bacterium GWE1_64_9]
MSYYRPIPMADPARPADALPLAGGWLWFDRVEVLARDAAPRLMAAADLPPEVKARLTAPRADLAGLALDRPRLMGILNVTPDSFSDGGQFLAPEAAVAQGRLMAGAGAEIIDVGGESTRPGAAEVAVADEIARTAPVIAALRAGGIDTAISIDTRKGAVAHAALAAGADIVNDVSAFTYDLGLKDVTAQTGAPLCLMHAQGTPQDMQTTPMQGDAVPAVRDFLQLHSDALLARGVARERIVWDYGIGFGKSVAQNFSLLARQQELLGLDFPLLAGWSRKGSLGQVSGLAQGQRMVPSVAAALLAVERGARVVRVHDVADTVAALTVWQTMHDNN